VTPGVASSDWIVVQCDECGGAVAYDPTHALVRCLFCAAVALRPVPAIVPPPSPHAVLPFVLDEAAAQAAFGRWVRASWWRPKALREAQAAVQAVWIPAWRVAADVELHWAALVSAATASGKRPRTGIDRGRAEAIVPASGAVSLAELTALRPFPAATRRWTDGDREVPCEVPALSEAGALAVAHGVLVDDRLHALSLDRGLSDAGGTARLHEVRTDLDALPLWIGSFRYRDRPWRVVINAATGKVVGAAPLDRIKVAIAIALLVAAVLVLARCERPAPELVPSMAAHPGYAPSAAAQSGSSSSQGTTASTKRPG